MSLLKQKVGYIMSQGILWGLRAGMEVEEGSRDLGAINAGPCFPTLLPIG